MSVFVVPTLQDMLKGLPAPQIPLHATWEEYRFRPFIQIHSAGSTGLPKLVTLRHGTFTAMDSFQTFQPNELAMRLGDMRLCVSFPPFHMAGVIYGLEVPCWVDSTVIMPPTRHITAEIVNAVHERAHAQYSLLTPSLVVDLAKNIKWLESLSRLQGLTFAGGPLPEATAGLVAQKTSLSCGYGSSEAMAIPLLPKAAEDWAYFHFNEKEGGLEFQERGAGLFELTIQNRPGLASTPPVFVNYPNLNEFASKDLFTPHPTKKGLWKFVSRLDDILVFSNGEKLNPVACENYITTSPDVKGCLVVGSGQFQPALLVEPTRADNELESLVERLWSFVQHANEM